MRFKPSSYSMTFDVPRALVHGRKNPAKPGQVNPIVGIGLGAATGLGIASCLVLGPFGLPLVVIPPSIYFALLSKARAKARREERKENRDPVATNLVLGLVGASVVGSIAYILIKKHKSKK